MKIIYARGFPYGAPLAMIRGGATKDATVKEYLRGAGFTWDGSCYAWTHYLHADQLKAVLTMLADLGCTVQAKDGLDANYRIEGF